MRQCRELFGSPETYIPMKHHKEQGIDSHNDDYGQDVACEEDTKTANERLNANIMNNVIYVS